MFLELERLYRNSIWLTTDSIMNVYPDSYQMTRISDALRAWSDADVLCKQFPEQWTPWTELVKSRYTCLPYFIEVM